LGKKIDKVMDPTLQEAEREKEVRVDFTMSINTVQNGVAMKLYIIRTVHVCTLGISLMNTKS